MRCRRVPGEKSALIKSSREYSQRMNTQTIAVICAGLGVIFSIVYVVLGVTAIKLLRNR